MGVKRIVDTDFWIDDKVLDFTVEDRYFMLYLLTNPQSRQLGAYKLPKKVMSFQTGYTVECITNLIDRFQCNYNMLIYNKITQEVAIKNYLKYSIISGGKPVLDCIKKDISLLTDKNLVGYIRNSLEFFTQINSKPIYLDILELIKDYNYNDNEIYNERIVPRFVDDSLKSIKQTNLKPLSSNPTDSHQKIKESETKLQFDTIWSKYPKKQGKESAYKAFLKSVKNGVTIEIISNGIDNYVNYLTKKGTEQQYIKNGSTWFNGQCWNDDYTVDQQKPSATSKNRFINHTQREYDWGAIEKMETEKIKRDLRVD